MGCLLTRYWFQSITEKQAKEMKQTREGRSILEDLNDRFVDDESI